MKKTGTAEELATDNNYSKFERKGRTGPRPDQLETVWSKERPNIPPGGVIAKFRGSFLDARTNKTGRKMVSFGIDPLDKRIAAEVEDWPRTMLMIEIRRVDYESSDMEDLNDEETTS